VVLKKLWIYIGILLRNIFSMGLVFDIFHKALIIKTPINLWLLDGVMGR